MQRGTEARVSEGGVDEVGPESDQDAGRAGRPVRECDGWKTRRPLDVEARTFWSTVLGAVLLVRVGAHGATADLDLDLDGVSSIQHELKPG
ncbi:TetR/AcrR family transcriptional regulator C-terminal domain-containing protein [Streptomyces sp. NPDC055013]